MKLAVTLLLGCGPPVAAAGKGSIVGVFAHPDDETTVGPLLAKYAAAGHEEVRCPARNLGIPSADSAPLSGSGNPGAARDGGDSGRVAGHHVGSGRSYRSPRSTRRMQHRHTSLSTASAAAAQTRAPQTRRRPFRTISDDFITTAVDATPSLDAAAKATHGHKTQWDAARMKEMDEMNRKDTDLFEGIGP